MTGLLTKTTALEMATALIPQSWSMEREPKYSMARALVEAQIAALELKTFEGKGNCTHCWINQEDIATLRAVLAELAE